LIEAQASEREAMRQQLGVQDKTVLVYVGKFGGRYLQKEMTEFFTTARDVIPNLFFLVLTQSDPDLIGQEFARREVPAEQFAILQSPPDRVGAYLAASDVALSLVEAFPSTVAMSPTKLGEYLAAGLPVVCNPGIGDVDAILTEHRVGVTVPEFKEAHYRQAAQEVLLLLKDNAVRERCRSAAHATVSLQEIGVPRYHQLYTRVARLAAEPRA
jgi:glycosyltransferase involved in cell wall biosynthesis